MIALLQALNHWEIGCIDVIDRLIVKSKLEQTSRRCLLRKVGVHHRESCFQSRRRWRIYSANCQALLWEFSVVLVAMIFLTRSLWWQLIMSVYIIQNRLKLAIEGYVIQGDQFHTFIDIRFRDRPNRRWLRILVDSICIHNNVFQVARLPAAVSWLFSRW